MKRILCLLFVLPLLLSCAKNGEYKVCNDDILVGGGDDEKRFERGRQRPRPRWRQFAQRSRRWPRRRRRRRSYQWSRWEHPYSCFRRRWRLRRRPGRTRRRQCRLQPLQPSLAIVSTVSGRRLVWRGWRPRGVLPLLSPGFCRRDQVHGSACASPGVKYLYLPTHRQKRGREARDA